MVPKRKIAQACKAVEGFGIPVAKVKAALKELLKVYDNQWMFIEDDSYRLLLDFLLENKPKENEPLEKKARTPQSNVEAKEKSEKKVGCKLENNQGNELSMKRPRSRRHRKPGSQLLKTLDTPLQLEISTRTQYDDSDIDMLPSELEDSGLIRKRSRRKWAEEAEQSQTCWMKKVEELSELSIENEQTASHSQNNEKRSNLHHSFKIVGENKPSYRETKMNYAFVRKKRKTLALSVTPSEEEGYVMEKCLAVKELWADHFLRPGDADNVLDMYHNPLNHPAEEPCYCSELPASSNQYHGDEAPCENYLRVQRDELKFPRCEFSHKEAKDSNGTNTNEAHFDNASSLKGEVKISLIHDFSQLPNLSVSCLDDVLKVVDDKCRELYKITESGFTAKLMMEVCQCFLAMGTDPQFHPTAKAYVQFESGISFNIQNLFKLVPGIPRHPFCSWFDNIHYFVNVATNNAERDLLERRGIKLIGSQTFPLITPNNDGNSVEFFYAPRDLVCKKTCVKIEPFHISELESCLRNGMDCLSSSVPHVCKTWCKCSYKLEIMVKKELLDEWISINRGSEEAEERHFPGCEKRKLTCCKNVKVLNRCSSNLARIFTGNTVNLQIKSSEED